MVKRKAARYISELANYFPVITITGPRQSGKTTLARFCFSDYQYCTLENPDTRELAETDPHGFFDRYSTRVIIDEVQRVPSLLSYIQGIVDERKQKADFIVTGSHQPLLKQSIVQSLAGRTGLVKLYPFSQSEVPGGTVEKDPFELCFSGFFPVVHTEDVPPEIFYPNYYQTYLERDISQLIELRNTRQFRTFIRLIAGRTGQLVNYNSIASDSGVSHHTIKEWISILEASFLVYTLPPYYGNLKKRLVKSPKTYLTDSGLLCSLLGIETRGQLVQNPLRGNIFENYVILDILKEFYHQGKEPKVYFLRDSKGMEVDLLIEDKGLLKLVEIKSSKTWNSSFGNNLKTAAALFDAPTRLYVVYAGNEKFTVNGVHVLPSTEVREILEESQV